jgi:hypothetical protein
MRGHSDFLPVQPVPERFQDSQMVPEEALWLPSAFG